MIIVWLAKILAALNANIRPGEVGAAIAYAFLVALIPGFNLLGLGLLVLSFFLRINNAMFFVFLAVFALLARFLDPITEPLGYFVLTLPPLAGLFTALANTPIVPWTAFNHSLVMGGLLFGLAAFIPLMLLFAKLVKAWRSYGRERFVRSKPVQAFLKWPLVSVVSKLFGKIWAAAQEFV